MLCANTRAADLLPKNIDAQIKAGQLLLLARAFEDAKTRADHAIEIDPKNVDAQVLRGNALAGLKDLDGAITEYEEALALDPSKNTAVLESRRDSVSAGQARGSGRDVQEGRRSVAAIGDRPSCAREFLVGSGRRADSEQALKDALAIEPVNVVANRALGLFYMSTGRAAEAEPYFVTIARASNWTATLALADYYIVVKRYDEARRKLHDLTVRPESYSTATLRLASIDALEGNRAHAQELLHEVLEKQPKNAPALLLSARLFFVDGKRDEGVGRGKSPRCQ